MTGVCTSIWNNKNELHMTEWSRLLFSKEGSLHEVPYVEPSFMEVIISTQWFHGLMKYEKNDMNYVIWYLQYVLCCLQNDKYDDACYSHGMTFLIRIWQVHWFDFP